MLVIFRVKGAGYISNCFKYKSFHTCTEFLEKFSTLYIPWTINLQEHKVNKNEHHLTYLTSDLYGNRKSGVWERAVLHGHSSFIE